MTALITTQRYNWMGYNGTETQEVDTALLRSDDAQADNYSYAHRQQVIAELKERLYHIKRDLDLIPEEELRAEEAERQRRREQRKRREEEARAQREAEEAARREEAERQRREREEAAEAARRQQEEDEARRKAEEEEAQRNAARMRQLNDSDEDSDQEEELNAALSAMPRTQAEIDAAVQGFGKGTRMYLASNGSGYVSYLDGSSHPSTAAVEGYNAGKRAAVVKATAGLNVHIPAAEEYDVAEARAATEARDIARKKLDAYRALQDPTYAARIRSSEKDRNGKPTTALTAEDGDEEALAAQVEQTKQNMESVRQAYNARAAASGSAIAAALCSHPPAAEEEVAPAAAEPEAEAAPAEAEEAAVPAASAPAEEDEAEEAQPQTGSKKNTPKANDDEL